ncbi:MAG: epoxyqueuosine reductase QueH [Clostridia bacterium]|nr:epoxyqueuosine reductase QueH [Clostridia bacterium]
MKQNYDGIIHRQIEGLATKKRLLLHCCCAPCSSACLERLFPYFDITVFFYNPNIETEEYLKRKAELLRLIKETGWAKELDCEHEKQNYYSTVRGLENEKEGGKRCEVCFKLRLEKTAETAEKLNFDYFATTLTISPLKNANLINSIGEQLAEGKKVKWLYSDFKKRDGYLNSLRLSEKYDLYRQDYCGCVYSINRD